MIFFFFARAILLILLAGLFNTAFYLKATDSLGRDEARRLFLLARSAPHLCVYDIFAYLRKTLKGAIFIEDTAIRGFARHLFFTSSSAGYLIMRRLSRILYTG